MLHSPTIADPCQPSTVNSYAIGVVDVGACAVQFVNRARNQNERRIAALDRYAEGWAEANVDKILDATAPNYRFTDPLVGSFSGGSLHEYFDMLQASFSRAGTITKRELVQPSRVARWIALMILRWVPQRQILPSMCSTMSSRVVFLLPASSAAACMICPDWQ
jgi:hypothetical protein